MNHSTVRYAAAAMCCSVFVVTACGGDAPSSDDRPGFSEEEALAEMAAAGTVIPLPDDDGTFTEKAKPYIWLERTSSIDFNAVHGGPRRATHACFMTGIAGDHDYFLQVGTQKTTCWKTEERNSEGQALSECYREPAPTWYTGGRLGVTDDGFWLLEVAGYARGSAVCVPHSNFTADSGSVAWISNELGQKWRQFSDYNKTFNLWWGDAASYLSTLRGQWDGFGEKMYITQSTGASTSSRFHVKSDDGEFLEEAGMQSGARSYFVGRPGGGKLVTLHGYNSQGNHARGNVNSAGTFELAVGNNTGYSGAWLSHINVGVCYLTYVAGDFDGMGEKIRIIRNQDNWYLQAQGTSDVRGRARCMAYDQRS